MKTTSLRKRYTPEQKAQRVVQVLKEDLSLAQIASEHGVPPNQLRQWKTQAMEGVPLVFQDDLQTEHERERTELYAEIGRLTTQLSWLKKNLVSSFSREERIARVDWNRESFSLITQCDLLGLNRSGLYYAATPPSPEEVAIKRRIDEIHTRPPYQAPEGAR